MWKDISRIALLGTDRTGIPAHLTERLEELDIPIHEDTAQTILNALSTAGQMRKAGKKFTNISEPLPETSPASERKACSPRSLRYLETILKRDRKELLFEFFELLERHDQQLPPEVLPQVLLEAKTDSPLYEALFEVAAPQILWLASYVPLIAKRTGDPQPEHWESGSREERVAFLRYLRTHAPDSARELLLETWEQESPEQRMAFLSTFSVHLDRDDEEILETALTDSRREVYGLAAQLLTVLPGSALQQRMRRRADRVIRYGPKGWTISLPATLDPTDLADGIRPKKTNSRSGGTRANHLVQLVGAVDPAYWKALSGQSPHSIVSAWTRGELAADVLYALTLATVAFARTDWAAAIFRQHLDRPDLKIVPNALLPELLPLLPTEAFNEMVRDKLRNASGNALGQNHPLLPILATTEHPLIDAIALLLIQPLQRTDQYQLNRILAYYYEVLNNLALRIDPALYQKLDAGWDQDLLRRTGAFQMVEQFQQTLLFRRDMRATFSV